MATRPVFVPKLGAGKFVASVPIEFQWHAGMARSQKQKCIRALHLSAQKTRGLAKILEISSKSEDKVGVELSAFNLMLTGAGGVPAPVEAYFQGSKVFERGGPYTNLYEGSSREAKADSRLKSSGALLHFNYFGGIWPLRPSTAFYDWLYLSALGENDNLAQRLMDFDAFSDIEFNPEKSINCQAGSAALFKALSLRGLLGSALSSPQSFLETMTAQLAPVVPVQSGLF